MEVEVDGSQERIGLLSSYRPVPRMGGAVSRRVVWKDATPNLNEGIFASLWALHHAIKTNPGGISEPMQIAVLERTGGAWHGRVLLEEEQQEHFRGIEDVESYLEKYFRQQPSEPLPAEPKPRG